MAHKWTEQEKAAHGAKLKAAWAKRKRKTERSVKAKAAWTPAKRAAQRERMTGGTATARDWSLIVSGLVAAKLMEQIADSDAYRAALVAELERQKKAARQ